MANTTMSAVKWIGANQLETVEVSLPKVPDGWVLVEVAYSGICGTDLAIFHGKHPRAQEGLIPGHEISGVVAASGDSRLPVGTKVIAEPLISCGQCGACKSGNSHVCKNLGLYGIDVPGAMADFVALPASILHVLPDSIDLLHAALVEPLAVAFHAVNNANIQPEDVVAIAGGGPIGMLTALVARSAGAAKVVVSELSEKRRQVANDYGFTVAASAEELAQVVDQLTDGEGVDVFFDTAGHPSVAKQSTELVRVQGRIVIVGVHKAPAAIDLRDICFKELSMRGVRVYTTADVDQAIAALADGLVDVSQIPIEVFALEEADRAFAAAQSADGPMKVMTCGSSFVKENR